MKHAFVLSAAALLLVLAAGCEDTILPGDTTALLAGKVVSLMEPLATQDQLRDQLRLMDGSCTEDGSQNHYGPNAGGSGGNGGGSGDQDRNRDGSCGD